VTPEEYDAAIRRLDAETEAKIQELRKLAGLHAGRHRGRHEIVDPVPPPAVPVMRGRAITASLIITVVIVWLGVLAWLVVDRFS
jgi:hypothetical protein